MFDCQIGATAAVSVYFGVSVPGIAVCSCRCIYTHPDCILLISVVIQSDAAVGHLIFIDKL